jgi:hypothetical protein
MQSKLRRNLCSIVSGRSMEKENLTQIMKDKERNSNLKRSSPICRKIRVTRILRKTLESGVISTTSIRTTLMNVAQYNHWWPSSKIKSQTPTWIIIQKIIKGDRSLMQNLLLLSHYKNPTGRGS